MPTSSIFANTKITDPKKAEAFINSMDAAVNKPKRSNKSNNRYLVTDVSKIKETFAKLNKK